MNKTKKNHGWVVTGVNPLTQLREVISTVMLWDVAVNKAATNHTHINLKVMRYNQLEVTQQGIIKQQSLTFGTNHILDVSEEGDIYCDGITCEAWKDTASRCDSCPVPPIKQKMYDN